MTHINIVAPISIRRPSLPNLALPKIGIGAAMAAIFKVMVDAVDLAYAAPYRTTQPKTPIVFDADLEGRDPSW